MINGIRVLLACGLMLLLAPVRVAHADKAQAEARRGTRLYKEGNYEEAAAAFERARELSHERGNSEAALDYNLGTTYARKGDVERAVESLTEAIETPNDEDRADVRERALYNLGVSEARKAEALKEQAQAQPSAEIEPLQRALEAFRQTLILDSNNEDARHNFAVTQRRLKELEASQQQPPTQKIDSPEQDEGEKSDEESPSGQDESGQSQDDAESSESSSEQESQSHEPGSDGQDDKTSTQNQAGEENGERFEENEASSDSEQEELKDTEQRQEGGLEATPSPTPAPASESAQPPQEGEPGSDSSGEESKGSPSAPGGMDREPEPTQEELDALRVLNSLEEGSPEQFKQLFRFRGGETKNLERDW